jgi:hypothetical protein
MLEEETAASPSPPEWLRSTASVAGILPRCCHPFVDSDKFPGRDGEGRATPGGLCLNTSGLRNKERRPYRVQIFSRLAFAGFASRRNGVNQIN